MKPHISGLRISLVGLTMLGAIGGAKKVGAQSEVENSLTVAR